MSRDDRTSIQEAMEQQTILVAKAGIVCKLNARATVVAVMNPAGGIYDNQQSLERNSRLGSTLLSRFDLIFPMLGQAKCRRDENIARFLLQQSIAPGSGYDRPPEMEGLVGDENVDGHWSKEKLRAYVAAVREKFRPTLTPEVAELLENHYHTPRAASREGKTSARHGDVLESLIRLSQAHARLMYHDKVFLDDDVAVILLMEYTAAASNECSDSDGISAELNWLDDEDDEVYKDVDDDDRSDGRRDDADARDRGNSDGRCNAGREPRCEVPPQTPPPRTPPPPHLWTQPQTRGPLQWSRYESFTSRVRDRSTRWESPRGRSRAESSECRRPRRPEANATRRARPSSPSSPRCAPSSSALSVTSATTPPSATPSWRPCPNNRRASPPPNRRSGRCGRRTTR